ncbi:MAG: ligase-associated DNA damage response endonuclease PdeM [Flavisolibacter sp.]|nr:ligase-associated DNA damage response endonuclease PdeM [Flavisolibacter sp.]
MQAPLAHIINGQTFWLSAQRSLFWEDKKALILSDVHLGKSGHFRKAGIAVPQAMLKEDMQRLLTLLQFFKPEQLIVVGDFFHSDTNRELDFFKRWRQDFSYLKIRLVKGNHDVLPPEWYREADVEVVEGQLIIRDFCFTHERFTADKTVYTFSGHIHPGVVVNGLGKQSLRFPCFYFTPTYGILPAFGTFTGTVAMRPNTEGTVFAIVNHSLIKLQ